MTVDTASTAEVSQALKDPPQIPEKIRCSENLCLITDAKDSDGDGVADDDEEASGTSPNDPASYPALQDLANLIGRHELPTFRGGRSALVSIPTISTSGFEIFGGLAALPGRQSVLEQAGISLPGELDLANGLSVTRGRDGVGMVLAGLFRATGAGFTHPVGQIAQVLSGTPGTVTDPKTEYEYPTDGGAISKTTAFDSQWGEITILHNSDRYSSRTETRNADGDRSVIKTSHTNEDGTRVETTVFDGVNTRETSYHTTTIATHSVTVKETSKDGKHTKETSTTTTTTTSTVDNQPRTATTTKITECHEGSCTTTTANGWRDPDYVSVGVSPTDVHAVLVARGNNINVGNPENARIYEYKPESVGNKWGPIALYEGEQEGVITFMPTFVHVPSAGPEFHPDFQNGLPPGDLPDPTCTYCY